MKRFKTYINEGSLTDKQKDEISDEIIYLDWKGKDQFFKDTAFYWSKFYNYYKDGNRFYRGMNGRLSEQGIIKDVRQDRNPRDISVFFHDMFNQLLKKKYGFHRGNCLFVASKELNARWYAKQHSNGFLAEIYPIGKFDWIIYDDSGDEGEDLLNILGNYEDARIISEVRDKKSAIERLINRHRVDTEQAEKLYNSAIDDIIRISERYKKNGIINGDEDEIMIKCNKYYVFKA